MFGIGSAIKMIVIGLIAVMLMFGAWYVTDLKAALVTSEANNAKLEDGIKEQTALIEQMKFDIKQIQEINNQLEKDKEKLKADSDNLASKFDKRDFGVVANAKPKVVEKLVNRGTVNALRCLELASGAPLNEKEKNAKSPTEANRECPALINPNYQPAVN